MQYTIRAALAGFLSVIIGGACATDGFAQELPNPSRGAKPASKHATKKSPAPPAVRKPFINGHYVLRETMKTNGYHSNEPVVVVVDKSSHYTHVLQLQGDEIVRINTLSNSIGAGATPTPPGRYWVRKKELDPKWIPPKTIDPKQKPVEPYKVNKKNGLGVAKINLNKFEIVLHGTNAPDKIRKNVSHGCVRHSNADIMRLYGLVKPGTVVYIVNKWTGKVINQEDFGIKKQQIATGATTRTK
jgi:lipoprotein-anchoring transpeptidase ErfK/SrfK